MMVTFSVPKVTECGRARGFTSAKSGNPSHESSRLNTAGRRRIQGRTVSPASGYESEHARRARWRAGGLSAS